MSTRSLNLIEKNDWLVLPRKVGQSFSITWRESGKRRQERYNLLEGFFFDSSEKRRFQGAKPVLVWVANVYYDERFGEKNVSELTLLGYPEKHIRSFNDVGQEGNWVKTQVNERFWYGQDDAEKPKKRWVVYHPEEWKPKQANFIQGAFESLAAQAFPEAVKAVASKGLKAVDATGLVAAALDKSGLWDIFKSATKDFINNKFGHSLHRFSTDKGQNFEQDEENVKSEKITAEREDFDEDVKNVFQNVDEKVIGRKLEPEEKKILAEIVVAVEFVFTDDIAEEGQHNVPR
ncbi:hypothetical protein NHQ30_002981 [Ciborinia camelliae]|nr:hypothetical protein NHQ30_002981 [Ciborinia camelliae]